MARTSTGKPVGRPKGTRTATVELETLSFKAPKEFVERVKRYAKQCLRPVSELVRDGLEWRVGAGDPLNIRFGVETGSKIAYEGNTGNTDIAGVSGEALHGMLLALVAEVRQLRESVQALERRSSGAENVQASDGFSNTGITSFVGDTSKKASRQKSTTEQAPLGEGVREDIPAYDTATRVLGKLCPRNHEWGHTGQSLLKKANLGCPECDKEKARERRKAKHG